MRPIFPSVSHFNERILYLLTEKNLAFEGSRAKEPERHEAKNRLCQRSNKRSHSNGSLLVMARSWTYASFDRPEVQHLFSCSYRLPNEALLFFLNGI